MVRDFSGRGSLDMLLESVGLSRSSYYYRGSSGKRGRRASGQTYHEGRGYVPDEEVVGEIEDLLGQEFVVYGYRKVTSYLRDLGYVINKKKVYRLMKERSLLLPRRCRQGEDRLRVRSCVVVPSGPGKYYEMDIKDFWVSGEGRNAYFLSVLDLFHRGVVGWRVGRRMRKRDVVNLLKEVFPEGSSVGGVYVRTDNGPQFISKMVRRYFGERGIVHEFTHPRSPEEIGHIESFHSLISTEVEGRFEFETLEELEEVLRRYIDFYNNRRLHGALGNVPPKRYLEEYLGKNGSGLFGFG